MVNEEDYVQPIKDFVREMIEARVTEETKGKNFPVILHAGESDERKNDNLYDAILMDTLRIGHGFNLIHHPNLIKIVKEKQICIECCPISNLVLAYVNDMRLHPVRSLLHQGIPVSISPDDPGFFGYDGVTLDYLYAFIAWELSLADLKKLCLNSLEYSIIESQDKEQLRPFFEKRWSRFLQFATGKF